MNDSSVINNLENLKTLRENKHITQTQLSVELGVSQELISRYEIGATFPQPNMLINLSKYFNCSIDYLLGQTNITTPVNILASNSNNLKSSELYNKYNSLSDEDKMCFDRFLSFLLDNSNKPK